MFKFVEEMINDSSKIFFMDKILEFKGCIQCGVCVASCLSSKETAWHIRKLIRKMQIDSGGNLFLDDELWNCTTCYTCQERCPKQIPIIDIVKILRNAAVKRGYIKDAHKKVVINFIKFGHAVPINNEVRNIRKELGLTEVPPTVQSNLKIMEDILTLIRKTGFEKIIKELKW